MHGWDRDVSTRTNLPHLARSGAKWEVGQKKENGLEDQIKNSSNSEVKEVMVVTGLGSIRSR